MAAILGYGKTGRIRFDWPRPIDVTDCAAPRGEPLADPASAARRAVESPEGFPPLAAATVPGDRIVLAVNAEVPQAAAVVAGIVSSLLASGAQSRDITIAATHAADELKSELTAEVRDGVQVATHDPDDAQQLAYLAASHDAQPIYVNRLLTDADLLIPIGVLQIDHSLGYLGPSSGVFPSFSDRATQRRFATRDSADWRKHESQRRGDADEAVWLLGVQFVVQVVPGPGDSLLHVLAGAPAAVSKRGRELCVAAWRHEVPRRVGLVVASIDGGPAQQTWSNFARALSAAARVVDEDGAIVLCTELNTPPGPAMKEAARTLVAERAPRRRRKREVDQDTLPAALLSEVARRHRVYLLSELDEDTVEELGLGRIADPAEIARLGRLHDTCVLIGGAQHAMLTITDEGQDSSDVPPEPSQRKLPRQQQQSQQQRSQQQQSQPQSNAQPHARSRPTQGAVASCAPDNASDNSPDNASNIASDVAPGVTSDVALVDVSDRTRIVLTGGDRVSFLQGLCTNDIKRLKPGQGCEAFFCNVQGKILGYACVFAGDDALTIDASPGQAGLLQHLDRYLIREDVQLRDVSAECRGWLLAGPRAAETATRVGLSWPAERYGHATGVIAGRPVVVHHVDWVAPSALLVVTAREHAAAVVAELTEAGATAASPEWYEWRRVESGTPLYGRDISIDNLPQELGRDERAINFNKGCYLGQEPIARIDAMGHVNWRLVGLERPDRSELPVGELASSDGKIVARVTSGARAPDGSAWLALAYVRRGLQTPGTRLAGPWGEALVVSLPRTGRGD